MYKRPFWINRIYNAWMKRSVIWLSGARRVGKTTLTKMLENPVYMNCDLPSVHRKFGDPEAFYESIRPGNFLVFDEIHRLEDPSRILKIGADEYPQIKILATGSSTLEASRKFRDSLTGRKIAIYLPPVIWDECREVFGINDLDQRLLFGGLPEPLLSESKDPAYFSEWFDSFFARDIQELFSIRNRTGYLKLMQLIYRSSGSLLDYTQLSKNSGLSRPTVVSYIESLRIAQNIYLLTPFHGGGKREITSRPKAYAFDTGLITFVKGWNEIRDEDRGILWEHLVLDLIRSYFPDRQIYYWRDKSNREIDFVLPFENGRIDIIECKVNPDHFSIYPVRVFRELYPKGNNICYSPYIRDHYTIKKNGIVVYFTGSFSNYPEEVN
jgi:predicted AAA+ superfamily ATPase